MTTRRNFLKQSLLAAGAASVPAGNLLAQEKMEEKRPKYNLPYKNTYLKEPFVTENEFRTAKPETITPGTFEEAKQILPDPTWSGHEKEIEMYWKAWQIGIGNIKAPEPDSGFVCSYLDVAYNGNIFMWDSAFMMMFARFGTRFFPFQRTLDNFYAKQHPDGFICREIKADGADCFERYDPTSTGPNILPWSEIVYYKQFGDIDRLHKIFPALCAYYKWLKLNHTWRNGTYWTSGWGTGMDNMPRVEPKYNPIYSHGHMIWLDVCLQQYFTAGHLLEMGFYLERWQEIEEFDELGEFIDFLKSNLKSKKLEELQIPLIITATDLDHGRLVHFHKGDIAERVAASCCMPVLFAPVNIDGTHYVDGGLLMNLPVSTLRRICEKVIAVNVSPLMATKYKMNIVSIALRSYNFMFRSNSFPEREKADLLIEPYNLEGYSNTELEKAEEIFMQGYNTTNDILERLLIDKGSIWKE